MNKRDFADHERVPLQRRGRLRTRNEVCVPQSLTAYSEAKAWVLIGDPGAGKTDVFRLLSVKEGGYFISAKNFIDLGIKGVIKEPLFIDGLDETSGANGLTALGSIRSRLSELNIPQFRLSCREADWRGSTDSQALKDLVGEDNLLELHLEPLSENEILDLLSKWLTMEGYAAEQFVTEARRRDLDGLLDNPQTLKLLAEAVKANGNDWPANKQETYALACKKLVREHNAHHRDKQRERDISDAELLEAAGYLNAVLLLSGSNAVTNNLGDAPAGSSVVLNELPLLAGAPEIRACRAVLETHLFRSDGKGNFESVHRTVAEYLAAQYLADRINNKLPVGRVLALLQGIDEGVVPQLRGLVGWLATLGDARIRNALIERDALAIMLYGDVAAFSTAEKTAALQQLARAARQDRKLRRGNWAGHPFGALATSDMEQEFLAFLRLSDRSLSHLALVECLLDAIRHGALKSVLFQELERILRDGSYGDWPRKLALLGIFNYAQEEDQQTYLLNLLKDVWQGQIEDGTDELLGELLNALYPQHIPPANVWQYLRKPKADSWYGAYDSFWSSLERRPGLDIANLLDALQATGFQLQYEDIHWHPEAFIGGLLVKGVIQFGAEISTERLYGWLSLGLGPYLYCPLDSRDQTALRDWLGNNSAIYKSLLAFGLHTETGDGSEKLYKVSRRLYDAEEPADIDQWYYERALCEDEKSLRQRFVQEAHNFLKRMQRDNAALELFEKWLQIHPEDEDWINTSLAWPYPPTGFRQQELEAKASRSKRQEQKENERREFFQTTMPTFAGGKPDFSALVHISSAYLKNHAEARAETPAARLSALLFGDPAWISLAEKGLRDTLHRNDLPSFTSIIDKSIQGARYNLALPCLAGMDLVYRENQQQLPELPDPVLETLVAFHWAASGSDNPDWYKKLVGMKPLLVAKVLTLLISKQIASGKEHVDGAYQLAYDNDYQAISQLVVPELLRWFPAKASPRQSTTLLRLLLVMLKMLQVSDQTTIISGKLDGSGLAIWQRAYWLSAAVMAQPERYLAPAKAFFVGNQKRTIHLLEFLRKLESRNAESALLAGLPLAVQDFLLASLCPVSRPAIEERGIYAITRERESGQFVSDLINQVAANPDEEAALILTSLRQRADTKQWHEQLASALVDHAINRRKTMYKPFAIAQVCNALANRIPTSAADLWALLVWHLQELAHHIRHGSTNDYNQYWDGMNPKSEDDCRDALLSDLRLRLIEGVQAEPEGRYADAKRSDIKVMYSSWQIPVEIKKESHDKLWTAITNQLIACYCREWSCGGFGIYLVFWFGGKWFSCGPADGGSKPQTSTELEQRLQATVPAESKHKIKVLVVDCSRPTK